MTDVIGEMLNDTSKDMRYKRIFIYDIDPCEYNMYPMQEIEQLAQNISECGLLHPYHPIPQSRWALYDTEWRTTVSRDAAKL